jgi:DNA adenine methylase
MENSEKQAHFSTKPIIKWAGGKTQMLNLILPKIPVSYGKYIEPFFGGGALFFALQPENAIISDSNPELINMYQQVAYKVEEVILFLQKFENSPDFFYEVRAQDWLQLSKVEAAARMLYLNKTCFNGLYRVNKKGQFNVPFGKYLNPKICDEKILIAASKALQKAQIICGDYLDVLNQFANPSDFIFLDPPYVPVSEYANFKRYTKDQFHNDDHIELAKMVSRLHDRGCYVLLTNSNHPLVYDLYAPFNIEVFQTKRYISCSGTKRKGEDVIITIPSRQQTPTEINPITLTAQVDKYPTTRFMGSKSKLLPQIWSVVSKFRFDTVVDLFAGSGIVGYMFKAQGKSVISNDYLALSAVFSKAMIENSTIKLPISEAEELLITKLESDHFVSNTFKGLYFTDEENELIDTIRTNISTIKEPYKHCIAKAALIRACTKKRPRGIFTYTGQRYNDGRMDLRKSLAQQYIEAVEVINNAIFDNGQICQSTHTDAMTFFSPKADLVYIDPPYYTPHSDNEYVRRYHFVEGLARNWQGVEIQQHTKTKKFKSYPTPFSTEKGATAAFDLLFKKFSNSILVVSYSSNSLPNKDDMLLLLSKYKENVEVVPIDYHYSFGNQTDSKTNRNKVQEYLFVAY